MMPRPSPETMENGYAAAASFGRGGGAAAAAAARSSQSTSLPSAAAQSQLAAENDFRQQAAAARFNFTNAGPQAPLTPGGMDHHHHPAHQAAAAVQHPMMAAPGMGGFRHDMTTASPGGMNAMGGGGFGFAEVSPGALAAQAQRMQLSSAAAAASSHHLYTSQMAAAAAAQAQAAQQAAVAQQSVTSPTGAFPGMGGLDMTPGGPMDPRGLPSIDSRGLPNSAGAPQCPPGSAPGSAGGGPMTQAEREEELLLNLLIARRQRGRMAEGGANNCPGPSNGKGGRNNSQALADELMRMRQQRVAAAAAGGGGGVPSPGGGGAMHASAAQAAAARGAGGGGAGSGLAGASPGGPGNIGTLPPMPGMPPLFSESGPVAGPLPPVSHQFTMNAGIIPPSSYDNYSRKSDSISLSTTNTHMQDGAERIDRAPPRLLDARSQDAMRDFSGRGLKRGIVQHHPHAGMGGFDGANLKFQAQLEMQGMNIPVKKTKRTHKKKPADMPRRPLSAYNLFFSEERERILKEIQAKEGNTSNNNNNNSKDDDKTSSETDTMETESSEPATPGSDDGGNSIKPKALMRPMIPSQKKRRPHRKTHGKISFQQLARMVGERWKNLPDDQRKYYQNLASEDMKRQKAAMEEYYAKQNADTKTSKQQQHQQQHGANIAAADAMQVDKTDEHSVQSGKATEASM